MALTTVKGSVLETSTDLASTDVDKGASLVGIHDADTLYTAATVEAVLAEVAKIHLPISVTHNFTSDASIVLTAAQELYGRIILTDTSTTLTGAVNVVCSVAERGYYIQNDTLQSITFKTSAGTGIVLATSKAAYFICDGTNVISPLITDLDAGVEGKGADVASSANLTLGTDGNYFDVTGGATISSIATLGLNVPVRLHFDAALTINHHSTDLILPGGANVTTSAGDELTFFEYDTAKWRCINYALASGKAIIGTAVELPYIKLSYTLAQGTGGGDSTGNDDTWLAVQLNTEDEDTNNLCTLASSQFTLPVGVYRVAGSSLNMRLQSTQIRLYDTTGSATLIQGTTERNEKDGFSLTTRNFIQGLFTINTTSTIEFQRYHTHTAVTTSETIGGADTNYGWPADVTDMSEVYAVLELWKIT